MCLSNRTHGEFFSVPGQPRYVIVLLDLTFSEDVSLLLVQRDVFSCRKNNQSLSVQSAKCNRDAFAPNQRFEKGQTPQTKSHGQLVISGGI